MKPLSGLDASFLYLETPETPMHVGSLNLYQLPAGFRGSFAKAVHRHLAERLHLVPLLRQRLSFPPLDLGHPVWVNAEAVDLRQHVHGIGSRLKPWSIPDVQAEAARLHGQQLDRSRPLWEFHVFDGVMPPTGTSGRMVAIYTKIHHAALDGKAGTLLANTILDTTPQPRPVPPEDPARTRRRQVGDPGTTRLIAAVLGTSLAQYTALARSLPAAARAVASTVSERVFPDHRGKTDWLHPKIPLSLAPRTRFNTAISAERSLATVSLPLNTCKSVAHTAGGSLNDLVLWLCSTALRDYLAQHGSLPRKSLVAAMPVSLREEGNQDLNTQASMVLVELGSQYRDPKRRMKAILDSTARVKESLLQYKNLLPTDYPSLLAPWLVGGVAKAVYKVYSATGLDQRLPMLANLVISNVPGPSVPLYLAGARMVTYHPMSIVVHGMALNITVQSYAGSIDFGIVAASEAAPHLDDLSRALEAAFRSATDTFAPQTAEKPPESPASTRAARARSRPRPT